MRREILVINVCSFASTKITRHWASTVHIDLYQCKQSASKAGGKEQDPSSSLGWLPVKPSRVGDQQLRITVKLVT
jgi:hypothetical protein